MTAEAKAKLDEQLRQHAERRAQHHAERQERADERKREAAARQEQRRAARAAWEATRPADPNRPPPEQLQRVTGPSVVIDDPPQPQ
jgi:hypothetical protein